MVVELENLTPLQVDCRRTAFKFIPELLTCVSYLQCCDVKLLLGESFISSWDFSDLITTSLSFSVINEVLDMQCDADVLSQRVIDVLT